MVFVAIGPLGVSQMNEVVSTVISKGIKGSQLAPGQYEVDTLVTLRIKGTYKVSNDVSYVPTVDIPMLPTLALLLEKAGIVGPAAERMLVEAMTTALNGGEQAHGAIAERLNDIARAEERVRNLVGQLPRKVRKGPSRWDGEVTEVVEVAEAA